MSEKIIERSKLVTLVIRNYRDLDLLGDTGILALRGIWPSTNGGAGMRVCAVVQNPLDTAILQVVGLVESSCHFGVVRLVSLSAVAAEGSTEFVGAGDAGEFADRGNDQGANARNGRCDDNDGVLDVPPADEFDTASGAEVGDAREFVQFRGLDDGCNHGAVFRIFVSSGEVERLRFGTVHKSHAQKND